VLITDAEASFDDEQRSRRHRYALLMTVHIIGFAAAGVLYYVAWWLGLVVMVATGVLPWIAVVAANDATPRRSRPAPPRGPATTPARSSWTATSPSNRGPDQRDPQIRIAMFCYSFCARWKKDQKVRNSGYAG